MIHPYYSMVTRNQIPLVNNPITKRIPKGTFIPSGWVIAADYGDDYLIDYIGNKKTYGTKYMVLRTSPIPDGWDIIQKSKLPPALQAHNIIYIMYIKNQPANIETEIIAGFNSLAISIDNIIDSSAPPTVAFNADELNVVIVPGVRGVVTAIGKIAFEKISEFLARKIALKIANREVFSNGWRVAQAISDWMKATVPLLERAGYITVERLQTELVVVILYGGRKYGYKCTQEAAKQIAKEIVKKFTLFAKYLGVLLTLYI